MRVTTLQEDPFQILNSTKPIVENLHHITIKEENLDLLAKKIAERLEQGLNSYEIGFGAAGNYEDDVQLIFIEDVVNFCFWVEKDKPRWQVASPEGDTPSGGWYSLVNCFKRALLNKIPILDTDYLISLSLEQAKELFMGSNGIQIPLMERRHANLNEAGKVLKSKFEGRFINLINQTEYDALKIVKMVYDNFTSFQDKVALKGTEIFFLKRAQIIAQDLSYLTQKYKNKKIQNLHLLTAFADYKLPQMLRKYGVIEYMDDLAQKVDNYVLIPAGSKEEVEIRSVTIWSIELMRQKLKKYTAADIDNALWLLSQDQTDVKPYHRTYTIFY